MNIERVDRHSFVFRQDDPGDTFAVIFSGSCSVFRKDGTAPPPAGGEAAAKGSAAAQSVRRGAGLTIDTAQGDDDEGGATVDDGRPFYIQAR